MARNDFPETVVARKVRRALVHDRGHAAGHDSIDDIGVAGDPTDVGGAPVDMARTGSQVEGLLRGVRGVDHVPADGVQDSLGLSR